MGWLSDIGGAIEDTVKGGANLVTGGLFDVARGKTDLGDWNPLRSTIEGGMDLFTLGNYDEIVDALTPDLLNQPESEALRAARAAELLQQTGRFRDADNEFLRNITAGPGDLQQARGIAAVDTTASPDAFRAASLDMAVNDRSPVADLAANLPSASARGLALAGAEQARRDQGLQGKFARTAAARGQDTATTSLASGLGSIAANAARADQVRRTNRMNDLFQMGGSAMSMLAQPATNLDLNNLDNLEWLQSTQLTPAQAGHYDPDVWAGWE